MRKKPSQGVAGVVLAGVIAVGGVSAAAIAQAALDPQEAHAAEAEAAGAWKKSSGKWYYLKGSGAMATNQWVGSYYVGIDGKWIKGYAGSSSSSTPNNSPSSNPLHL